MKEHTTPKFFWLIVSLIIGCFIYLISPILLPFIVGLGLAYILDPVTDRLEDAGCSRTLATSIIGSLFLLGFGVFLLVILPLLFEQIGAFFKALPGYIGAFKEYATPYIVRWGIEFDLNNKEEVAKLAKDFGDSAKEVMIGVLAGLLQSGMAVMNFLALLVITPVVSFYLLRDWDKMVAELDELLPRAYADTIREQLKAVDATLSSFLRGQVNVMLALASFYAITLSLAGLSYALIIAFIAGFMVIIPYAGTVISGALAVGLAYMQFNDLSQVAMVLGIFVIGQMLEGYVLTPRLIGKSVGLNPIWIIFGMMAGGAIMGFVGILIAVPITAVSGVLIRFAIAEYRDSEYYKGDRAMALDM